MTLQLVNAQPPGKILSLYRAIIGRGGDGHIILTYNYCFSLTRKTRGTTNILPVFPAETNRPARPPPPPVSIFERFPMFVGPTERRIEWLPLGFSVRTMFVHTQTADEYQMYTFVFCIQEKHTFLQSGDFRLVNNITINIFKFTV